MEKDQGSEHVYVYFMFRLGHADYVSKYDATPNNLARMWHVGAYYFNKAMNLIDSLG